MEFTYPDADRSCLCRSCVCRSRAWPVTCWPTTCVPDQVANGVGSGSTGIALNLVAGPCRRVRDRRV